MKKIGLLLFFIAFFAGTKAQEKQTIVGKWSVSKMKIGGLTLDIENPEKVRAEIIRDLKQELGEEPDSALVAASLDEVMHIKEAVFEFTADGKAVLNLSVREDATRYKVDYEKGLITTEKKEGKQTVAFRFENGMLILKFPQDENEVTELTLKRIK